MERTFRCTTLIETATIFVVTGKKVSPRSKKPVIRVFPQLCIAGNEAKDELFLQQVAILRTPCLNNRLLTKYSDETWKLWAIELFEISL